MISEHQSFPFCCLVTLVPVQVCLCLPRDKSRVSTAGGGRMAAWHQLLAFLCLLGLSSGDSQPGTRKSFGEPDGPSFSCLQFRAKLHVLFCFRPCARSENDGVTFSDAFSRSEGI